MQQFFLSFENSSLVFVKHSFFKNTIDLCILTLYNISIIAYSDYINTQIVIKHSNCEVFFWSKKEKTYSM